MKKVCITLIGILKYFKDENMHLSNEAILNINYIVEIIIVSEEIRLMDTNIIPYNDLLSIEDIINDMF